MSSHPKSLDEIQGLLVKGELHMVELVQEYLDTIERYESLNAYVEVYKEEALEDARKIDHKIAEGLDLLPLEGMVISVKDVIAQDAHGLSASSKILEGYVSPFSATAVVRLLKAGVIVIGRTNCDEFGMGSTNENSAHGPVLNALDQERIPGGSSGGAAVSVQINSCLIALGSDTGGSVRQPAAFCGVLGFKPSYGRISRYGLIAYASSFDQIGILGNSFQDIRTVLAVVEGKDEMDATSSSKAMENAKECKRLGYFKSMLEGEGLSQEAKMNFEAKLESYRAQGFIVEAFDFDFVDYLVPTYYILTTAEASTNLSRYDGVRYGRRSKGSEHLSDMYVNTRTEGFGKEVKRRIMLGTYVLSEGYFDAYYTKAQKIRRLIKDRVSQVLEDCDAIVLPSSTNVAWKVGEKNNDPVSMYLSDVYTVLANLVGMPCISLPSGNNSEGLPFGIQLMCETNHELTLLQLASSLK